MAIIKTFKGNKIGSTIATYWFSGGSSATQYNYMNFLGQNNYALIEDSTQSKLYFADSTNDSLSLVPEFDKKINFGDLFKRNLRHDFSSNLIFTNKPRITAKYNFSSSEVDEEIFGTQFSNHAWKNNLDIDDVYSSSNYRKFQDGDDTYHLFVLPNQNGSGGTQGSTRNTAPGSQVILAKGDDLSQTTYIQFESDIYNYNLLTVNVTERLIYLSVTVDGYQNASDGEYLSANYTAEYLHILPFEVSPDFQFQNIIEFIKDNTYVGNSFDDGPYASIFYLGQESEQKDCFLVLENKDISSSDQLKLSFLKINYLTLKNANTYSPNPNSQVLVLDCVESYQITLAANSANSTNYNPNQHNLVPSKLYNFDANNPNSYWFYIGYFLNNGNLSPVAFNWDKSETTWGNNTFSYHENLLSNVTVNSQVPSGATTDSIVNPYDILSGKNPAKNFGGTYESHIYTYVTSSNKLHFTFNYIDKHLLDDVYPQDTSLLSNTLSFGVDSSSPQTLTYENLSPISSLNSMLLKDSNDDYEELVVLADSAYKTYFYTQANGWVESYSETALFSEFTTDSIGRRWALEAPSANSYQEIVSHGYMYSRIYNVKLHLLSQVLPYSTSIEFGNTDVTYAGASIPNTLKVNAYDSTGARIAVDVLLKIEGTNMTFSGNPATIQKTVTTLTNGDTNVNVTITGPGYVNVSASFDI